MQNVYEQTAVVGFATSRAHQDMLTSDVVVNAVVVVTGYRDYIRPWWTTYLVHDTVGSRRRTVVHSVRATTVDVVEIASQQAVQHAAYV